MDGYTELCLAFSNLLSDISIKSCSYFAYERLSRCGAAATEVFCHGRADHFTLPRVRRSGQWSLGTWATLRTTAQPCSVCYAARRSQCRRRTRSHSATFAQRLYGLNIARQANSPTCKRQAQYLSLNTDCEHDSAEPGSSHPCVLAQI
eukprot:6183139-Pleurochrysis_carterae.AAC.6